MLKFFRRMRMNLLKEAKLRTYFFYALGEILLVMIGILLALQVNTWNEHIKDKKEEQKYLSDLLENIETDIVSFHTALKSDSNKLYYTKVIIDAFKDESLYADQKGFSNGILQVSTGTTFVPKNTIFQELNATGKLSIIRDDALRHQIQDYYKGITNLIENQSVNNEIVLNTLLEMGRSIDANSILEVAFPEFIRAEVDSLDLSFFQKSTSDPEVVDFVNNMTIRRTATLQNFRIYHSNLGRAIQLKESIIDYLQE